MSIGKDHLEMGGGDVSVLGSTHSIGRWLTCPSLMRNVTEG